MPDVPDVSLYLDELKRVYRERLRSAAQSSSSEAVGNRYPWQTRIAVEELLARAAQTKGDVAILSGCAPEGFFDGDLVVLLNRCADAGCAVRILAWTDQPRICSPSLRAWAESKRGAGVELRYSWTIEFEDRIPHFLTVGDKAYRQEIPHASFSNTVFTDKSPEIPARINFNDPDTAKELLDIFASAWAISREDAA